MGNQTVHGSKIQKARGSFHWPNEILNFYCNDAIMLWWAGLLLNFMWSPVWFGAGDKSGGLMILQALIVTTLVMAIAFYKVDKPAGLLQIPYLAWLTYAHYLSTQQQ
jgi:tryptophan-rich sensory protein